MGLYLFHLYLPPQTSIFMGVQRPFRLLLRNHLWFDEPSPEEMLQFIKLQEVKGRRGGIFLIRGFK